MFEPNFILIENIDSICLLKRKNKKPGNKVCYRVKYLRLGDASSFLSILNNFLNINYSCHYACSFRNVPLFLTQLRP